MAGTVRRVADLEGVVLQVQPGIAAPVHILKAIRTPLVGLHQESEPRLVAGAVVRVQPPSGVLAAFEQGEAGGLVGNGGGNHVQGAADSVRALGDGRRAGQHLHSRHAPDRGKVVGAGSGVRSRSDQHIVLQQGDAPAALGGHAADADVGPQPVAVLHLHGHPGHLADDALNVGMAKALQILLPKVVGAAHGLVDGRPFADDQHLLNVGAFSRSKAAEGQKAGLG